MPFINKYTDKGIVYDLQDIRIPQATSADVAKVIKVNAQGKYELGDGGGSGGSDPALESAKATGGIGWSTEEKIYEWDLVKEGKTVVDTGYGLKYYLTSTDISQVDSWDIEKLAVKPCYELLNVTPSSYGEHGLSLGIGEMVAVASFDQEEEIETGKILPVGTYFVINTTPYEGNMYPSVFKYDSTTITWDGKVDDRYNVTIGDPKDIQYTFVKMLDVALTSSQLSTSYIRITTDILLNISNCESTELYKVLEFDFLPVLIMLTDNVTYEEVVFPAKGIYIPIGAMSESVLLTISTIHHAEKHNISCNYLTYADYDNDTDGIVHYCYRSSGQDSLAGVVNGYIYYKEGTVVTANDAEKADFLQSITIGGTGYKIPQVTANNASTATTILSNVKINDTSYKLPPVVTANDAPSAIDTLSSISIGNNGYKIGVTEVTVDGTSVMNDTVAKIVTDSALVSAKSIGGIAYSSPSYSSITAAVVLPGSIPAEKEVWLKNDTTLPENADINISGSCLPATMHSGVTGEDYTCSSNYIVLLTTGLYGIHFEIPGWSSDYEAVRVCTSSDSITYESITYTRGTYFRCSHEEGLWTYMRSCSVPLKIPTLNRISSTNISSGTETAGKVLTSDGNGGTNWTSSGGGSSDFCIILGTSVYKPSQEIETITCNKTYDQLMDAVANGKIIMLNILHTWNKDTFIHNIPLTCRTPIWNDETTEIVGYGFEFVASNEQITRYYTFTCDYKNGWKIIHYE